MSQELEQNSLPAQSWPPELLLRAQGVRAALFDVDGVLTDGGLYFSQEGETLKRFNTLDGQGLKLLARLGITPVVISGRASEPLRRRLETLGIEHTALGSEDKLPAASKMLTQLSVTWQEVAVMGDDWPDLPLLTRATFACSPPNAHVEVRARAHYITKALGGQGAVREFCDLLIAATGRYREFLEKSLTGQQFSGHVQK